MVFDEMRPFTISDFQNRVRVKLSLDLTRHQMTSLLKNRMKMTYHKATTSPITLNPE